jgi:predicted P-type ATPase
MLVCRLIFEWQTGIQEKSNQRPKTGRQTMGGTYSYPDGPDACEGVYGKCPKISSPNDEGLIILYSFWGLSALALLTFKVYRHHYSKLTRESEVVRVSRTSNALGIVKSSFAHPQDDPSSTPGTAISPLHPTENTNRKSLLAEDKDEEIYESTSPSSILQIPFKSDTFGSICYSLVNLISISWLLIFLVIIVDVYLDCQFRGVDCLCNYGSWPILGDYDTSANYFFTTWCLSTVWYLGIVIYRDQLRGWFMLPCSVAEATHMYVWSRDVISSDGEILSDEVPFIVQWLRKLRMDLTPKHLQDGHETIVEVLTSTDKSRFFIHETTRYTFDENTQLFRIPDLNVCGVTYTDFHSRIQGLSSTNSQLYLMKFGPNKIPFERNTILSLLSQEMISYFYFYQFVSYIVWFWFSYIFVASIEASVVLLGGVVSVYIQWNNERTISSLTEYETTVKVKRDGQWTLMSSNFIVPGDILTITQSHWIIPCDMVLLSGQCIMNESGLTGESMPVQKIPCPNENKEYDHSGSKYTLYAGTTILQTTGNIECLVTKTGTGTSKGQLISTILYPEKFIFKYEEELEVTICFLLLFGLVALPLSFYLQDHNGSSSSWITKWAYGMFTVSQIFSPLLPVALKVGQIRSSKRLSDQKIFCVNPRRIAISGKVNIFCFDKTGTLTKEGMEFSGVAICQHVVNQSSSSSTSLSPSTSSSPRPVLSSLQRDLSSARLPPHLMECMACCHSLVKFGENEFVGNEVEINMFRASKWLLIQDEQTDRTTVMSPNNHERYVLLKKYDFDHSRQTMSVIVEEQTSGSPKNKIVYCKGSFEKVEALCHPETVPLNFKHLAREYAMDGGYVLGFGYRSLPLESEHSYETMPRDDIEVPGSFNLLGLMIFRNEPKDDSRDAILHIREGVVRPVMITGDNAQCGQYIARSCCLVNEGSKILLGEFDASVGDVLWTFMVDSEDEKMRVKLQTSSILEMITAQNTVEYDGEVIELALTGNHSLGHLEYTTKQLDALLIHIRIFARTSPDSKSMIVRKFRQHGFIVGMCGDGGNVRLCTPTFSHIFSFEFSGLWCLTCCSCWHRFE